MPAKSFDLMLRLIADEIRRNALGEQGCRRTCAARTELCSTIRLGTSILSMYLQHEIYEVRGKPTWGQEVETRGPQVAPMALYTVQNKRTSRKGK